MIRVRIGDMERELGSVNEHWINQQINRRRFDGQVVCVRVTVNESDLNMVLSTPTCPSNGCGGRPPRPHEREVFNLWDKHKLNEIEFTGGNLIGFLKRLKRTV